MAKVTRTLISGRGGWAETDPIALLAAICSQHPLVVISSLNGLEREQSFTMPLAEYNRALVQATKVEVTIDEDTATITIKNKVPGATTLNKEPSNLVVDDSEGVAASLDSGERKDS